MNKASEFANFDVVTDDSDHSFRGSINGQQINKSKGEVHRTIMKEWKILEQSLPETIYVRVYEQRIDLMRAAIVGAAGTPYHDGLFFFDLAFPSDYPKQPPQVRFRSFGHRINPNLYSSGRVCLSLLNTWHGKKSEIWDPCESTVLQVLLSIQGLVLNEKPYRNEPHASLRFDFEPASRAYDDKVYVMTLQMAIHLIRNPPKNFEDLVAAFFRQRAGAVVEACCAYMEGRVRVGYFGCASGWGPRSEESKVAVSQLLAEAMRAVVPPLVAAFRDNGASVAEPEYSKWVVPTPTPTPTRATPTTTTLFRIGDDKIAISKNNKGTTTMFKKVVEKIKKAFRWKKNSGLRNRSKPETV